MKIILLALLLTISHGLFAGDLFTNTNQSSMYIRLQARDAAIGFDGVYYNPAGLSFLENDGLFLSFHNQFVSQTSTITSSNELFNDQPATYVGDVSVLLFPSIFAGYKKDNFTISFGFNAIGGGGSATYEDGLPSFEAMIAPVVGNVQAILTPADQATGNAYGFSNVDGYNYDINFEGSSTYLSYQLNASYEFTEKLSVAFGGRYVTADNAYKGYISDIQVGAPEAYGGFQNPATYIRSVAGMLGSDQFEPYAQAVDAATQDINVDVTQAASGFIPIISLDAKVSEQLNLTFRYEFKTELEFETTVIDGKNGGGLYTDGAKSNCDIPAYLAIGAMYQPIEKLTLHGAYHLFFDKDADFGIMNNEVHIANSDILNNTYELAFGAEYMITDRFDASAGVTYTATGATEDYNTDLSYATNSTTLGAGVQYALSDMLELNVSAQYTFYDEGEKNIPENGAFPATFQTFDKEVKILAIGLNIQL